MKLAYIQDEICDTLPLFMLYLQSIQYVANHLGQGGFGSVFKAWDQDTGTLLALKRVCTSGFQLSPYLTYCHT